MWERRTHSHWTQISKLTLCKSWRYREETGIKKRAFDLWLQSATPWHLFCPECTSPPFLASSQFIFQEQISLPKSSCHIILRSIISAPFCHHNATYPAPLPILFPNSDPFSIVSLLLDAVKIAPGHMEVGLATGAWATYPGGPHQRALTLPCLATIDCP